MKGLLDVSGCAKAHIRISDLVNLPGEDAWQGMNNGYALARVYNPAVLAKKRGRKRKSA